jgi:hypothetical protein
MTPPLDRIDTAETCGTVRLIDRVTFDPGGRAMTLREQLDHLREAAGPSPRTP